MLRLADLQKNMRDIIVSGGGAAPELLEIIPENGIPAERRLQIHANNFRELLSAALIEIFPVCKAFVGEIFLKAALAKFVQASPPQVPVLSRYGADFAGFLEGFPPATNLPYLPDIIRLEWAVHDLQHAVEMCGNVQKLCTNDEKKAQNLRPIFKFSPNARLIESGYPLLKLWMVGRGQLPPEAVHIGAGGECVAALLQHGEVRLMALTEAQRQFVARLMDDKTASDNAGAENLFATEEMQTLQQMGIVVPV